MKRGALQFVTSSLKHLNQNKVFYSNDLFPFKEYTSRDASEAVFLLCRMLEAHLNDKTISLEILDILLLFLSQGDG
jgi:hypothetical protein